MYEFTEEELELLNKFFNTFKVIANSEACQKIKYDPAGFVTYEEALPYGQTSLLEILHDDGVVKEIEHPSNDLLSVLDYAKEWKELNYPIPGEEECPLFNMD